MRTIDADALKKELWGLKYTKESPSIILTQAGQEIFNSGIESAIATVLSAPTIEVKPVVHARWKMTDSPYCSHCRHIAVYKYRYCPDCGARMDGEPHDDSC